MRRRSGGRSTPAAESNKARPAMAMRPASGRSSPASMLTRVVLPAPERPNSASTPVAGSTASAAKVKLPRVFRTESSSILATNTVVDAPRQRLRGDERDEGEDQGDDREPERGDVAGGLLGQGVDGDGDGAGLAGDIADGDNGGAELTQATCEGKHAADQYARQRQRHGDGEEDAERSGAEGAGRGLQLAIDGFDRKADRLDHQGKAHHRGGEGSPFQVKIKVMPK